MNNGNIIFIIAQREKNGHDKPFYRTKNFSSLKKYIKEKGLIW